MVMDLITYYIDHIICSLETPLSAAMAVLDHRISTIVPKSWTSSRSYDYS